jgi:hypothetical protein
MRLFQANIKPVSLIRRFQTDRGSQIIFLEPFHWAHFRRIAPETGLCGAPAPPLRVAAARQPAVAAPLQSLARYAVMVTFSVSGWKK